MQCIICIAYDSMDFFNAIEKEDLKLKNNFKSSLDYRAPVVETVDAKNRISLKAFENNSRTLIVE